ncbi:MULTISPECIES: efflux RND transporter periplasmic adaptor subunit [unclassified Caulobacter]|uniref:efflux RND transporter periplasmic adaptor subunit n=1 Tax=unclassified Caulobacter TaxID=2648921 RepID=UPI000C145823|nr:MULTISPECIES: efflux RND transporter periplasmic adaptor subunit [unclassified Caulobacter]AZS21211.1 efflux RND transporter periplasmic adaptor subunit [Caulobacter sp. FWC26]
MDRHRPRIVAALLLSAASLAACGQTQVASAPSPPEVAVAVAELATVAPMDDLPARVVAFRTAEIRPQVSGVVTRRYFTQGGEVQAGQPLFQIDPAAYQAEAAGAQAALLRAIAVADRAKAQVSRLAPLVEADAISRQSYDDAVSAKAQAEADLAEARATLRRRGVELSFATVRAPISGRIGEALVTEGALVAVGGAGPMATVQQIDRVYVDVRQPSARLEALRALAGGGAGHDVEILSPSGVAYPRKGKLLFSGVTVDPATGDAIARVQIDNPDRTLLPGMFVRARLPRAPIQGAVLTPQQAVLRDSGGKPLVSLVNAKGVVETRPVEVGDVVDGRYVVTQGLKAGERVIVEGQDRVAAGTRVKTVPFRMGAR